MTLAAFEAWRARMADLAKFDRQTIGSELTEAGTQKRKELLQAVQQAEKNFRAAEDCEDQGRAAQARAAGELQSWINTERDRRRRAARPESPPGPQRLAEQLEKLKAEIG